MPTFAFLQKVCRFSMCFEPVSKSYSKTTKVHLESKIIAIGGPSRCKLQNSKLEQIPKFVILRLLDRSIILALWKWHGTFFYHNKHVMFLGNINIRIALVKRCNWQVCLFDTLKCYKAAQKSVKNDNESGLRLSNFKKTEKYFEKLWLRRRFQQYGVFKY